MAKQLKALEVENAKAREDRWELSDGRGLYLVVQPSGAKSWCLRYRRKADGRPRKVTLGRYPLMALVKARAEAAEAMLKVQAGGDPAAEKVGVKAAAKQAAADRSVDTVEQVVADFIELYAKRKKLKSWRTTERVFKKNVLTAWKGCNIHDIKKRDVNALIDKIAADRPIQANRIFAGLRKLFSWCIERDILAVSPCAGIKPPA